MVFLGALSCELEQIEPLDATPIGIPDPVVAPEEEENDEQEYEIMKNEYTNIDRYHLPDAVSGKTIECSGNRWELSPEGIVQPVNCTLYPNPVTPEMFNTAIDGSTAEVVETEGVNFSYSLEMKGKFPYKGNEIFGEVKLLIVKDESGLFFNMQPAEIVE